MTTIKFAHFADCHVGHGQWRGRAREMRRQDFADAFISSCLEAAFSLRVDFALFSGDISDVVRPGESARSVLREGLDVFRRNEKEVYAIFGNHDYLDRSDGLSIMHGLQDQGYLHLCDPGEVGGYTPYRFSKDKIDIAIYGMPWMGAATRFGLMTFNNYLLENPPDSQYSIFMAHVGLEGLSPVNFPETVSVDDLLKLKPMIDYVALGHIHKPYNDGYIRMPGSLEVLNKGERLDQGGFIITTLEFHEGRLIDFESKKILPKKRPWVVESYNVDEYRGMPELLSQIGQDHEPPPDTGSNRDPIVVVELDGVREYRIDKQAIKLVIPDALVIQVDDQTVPPELEKILAGANKPRDQIEMEYYESNLQEDAQLAMDIRRNLGTNALEVLGVKIPTTD